MSARPESPLKFFVYIIESPSAVDLYHGRCECHLLRQAINLDVTPCVTRTAISREAFQAAIRIGLNEAMSQFPGLIPILHISAHGSQTGIQLSTGEVIEWHDLKDLLRPVNAAFQGALIVCMSSCQGFAGTQMAMSTLDPDLPFFAIVGNTGEPSWADTAVAYASFYHLIANGEYVTTAVEGMRTASGNSGFTCTTAEATRSSFLAFVQNLGSNHLAELLSQSQLSDQPDSGSDLAKFLARSG